MFRCVSKVLKTIKPSKSYFANLRIIVAVILKEVYKPSKPFTASRRSLVETLTIFISCNSEIDKIFQSLQTHITLFTKEPYNFSSFTETLECVQTLQTLQTLLTLISKGPFYYFRNSAIIGVGVQPSK